MLKGGSRIRTQMQLITPWFGFNAGYNMEHASLHPAGAHTFSCPVLGDTPSCLGSPLPCAGLTATLTHRCSPWPVRTARTEASPAWMRGWRTSLPRGSSQKHCRKPQGAQGPSPAQHTPIPRVSLLVPVQKGCWVKQLTQGYCQGQGWGKRNEMAAMVCRIWSLFHSGRQ